MTDDLLRRATEVRDRAYAPYSGYTVGAAIEGADGQVWTGANFENVSYGGTICAERAAVAGMIADGVQEIARVTVVSRDGGTPCGLCLQVLLEFAPRPEEVEVLVANEKGESRRFTLHQLIPYGFRSAEVGRT